MAECCNEISYLNNYERQRQWRCFWMTTWISTRHITKMFSRNDTEITRFMDESSYIRHTISMISAEFFPTSWPYDVSQKNPIHYRNLTGSTTAARVPQVPISVNSSKNFGMLHAPDNDNKVTNSQSKILIDNEIIQEILNLLWNSENHYLSIGAYNLSLFWARIVHTYPLYFSNSFEYYSHIYALDFQVVL
jgi:hypothetical protein